eukprot:gene39262-53081_t
MKNSGRPWRRRIAARTISDEITVVGAARHGLQFGRDFLRAQVHIEQSLAPRFPDVAPDELRAAWADVMKRANLNQHHTINREHLSVREHMSIVLRHLQGRKFVEFENLFDVTRGVPVLIVTFIALLELAIDPACALVFESEPADEDVMRRPPRDPAPPLF